MIMFRRFNSFTTLLTSVLFLSLLFWPASIFTLFQIEDTASAAFMSRRAAMLFLGFAVLSWFSKDINEPKTIRAVSAGIATTMLTLAILGFVEWSRGAAGPMILMAVAAETALGLSYLWIIKTTNNKNNTHRGEE